MAGLESQDLCLPALARTAFLPRPASSQGTLKSGHPAPSTPDHTSQSCFLSLVWPQGFPFLLPGSRLLREALPILPVLSAWIPFSRHYIRLFTICLPLNHEPSENGESACLIPRDLLPVS